MSKLIIPSIIATLILTSQSATSQITNSKISSSNIVSGNNNSIKQNFITNKNYYSPGNLSVLSEQLERQISIISDANAEKAASNGNFRLAADIWDQVFLDSTRLKKGSTTLTAILVKKSQAESKFDKSIALKSVKKALEFQPTNLALLETGASLSIDLYLLDSAAEFLKKILTSSNSDPTKKLTNKLKYNTHYRLHIIHTLESKITSAIDEAIICSEIFTKEFSPQEQEENSPTQHIIMLAAMNQAVRLSGIPSGLFDAYQTAERIIYPGSRASYLATDNDNVWIDLDNRRIIFSDGKNLGAPINRRITPKEPVEYLIGDAMRRLADILSPFIVNRSELANKSELEGRRFIQDTYEKLVVFSQECKNCGLTNITSALGSIILAIERETNSDNESAHFYYSLAIRRLREADSQIKLTNSYRSLLIHLLQKIGSTRREIIHSDGFLTNQPAAYSPFDAALEEIDKALKIEPNDTKFIAEKITTAAAYSDLLIRTFNGGKGYQQCLPTHDLFESLTDNPYSLTEESLLAYINCTKNLLFVDKTLNRNEEYIKNINRFKTLIKRAGVNVDSSIFNYPDQP